MCGVTFVRVDPPSTDAFQQKFSEATQELHGKLASDVRAPTLQ